MREDLVWNVSPERLYIDCYTRVFLRDHLEPSGLATACNIGIGAGTFDDWLGHWLRGHGTMVSVDIDGDCARAFAERQEADGHPNRAEVVHGDMMQLQLGPFDLVAVVGSTLHETHSPSRALTHARSWVKPGGWLFATVVHNLGRAEHLFVDLPGVVHRTRYDDLVGAELTAVLARVEG